jgi:hypothetical protein
MRLSVFLEAWVRLLSKIKRLILFEFSGFPPAPQPKVREQTFYFRSWHGLACLWPSPQAGFGSPFWCKASRSGPPISRRSPPVPALSPHFRPPSSPQPCGPRGPIFRTSHAGLCRCREFGPRALVPPRRRVTMKARSMAEPAPQAGANVRGGGGRPTALSSPAYGLT